VGHLCSLSLQKFKKRFRSVALGGGRGETPTHERGGVQRRMRQGPHVLCCPDLVFSLRQVVCFVAAAPRRRVLHGGGLLGVVTSAPWFLYSALDHVVGLMST
jgi:hypothetical protein